MSDVKAISVQSASGIEESGLQGSDQVPEGGTLQSSQTHGEMPEGTQGSASQEQALHPIEPSEQIQEHKLVCRSYLKINYELPSIEQQDALDCAVTEWEREFEQNKKTEGCSVAL